MPGRQPHALMCLKPEGRHLRSNVSNCKRPLFQEAAMKAIVDLFSTDYGLFSVAVIGFTLFMGFWFSRFFKRKMDEDAARAQRESGRPS